ncbi:MAG: hypothetical protein ACYDER_01365 [Ktedonobacteraceae bacterium]
MQVINQNQKMNISSVREKLGEIFGKIYHEQDKRIIVEKSGIVVGAVVSPLDLKRLIELDKKKAEADGIFNRMMGSFKDIPEEEILENAVKATRKVRRQIYEERK